jgi:MerR family transcriptional regulator, Zn(II)-responsive regulator of zntA
VSVNNNTLIIDQPSTQASLSEDILRFYEKLSMINSSACTEADYRVYSINDLPCIGSILRAKQVGFTLKEMHQLLALNVTKDQSFCQDIKQFVDDKLNKFMHHITDIQKIKQSLMTLSDVCCGGEELTTHCHNPTGFRSTEV